MKIAPKATFIAYWDKLPENVKRAMYLKMYLGSNAGDVYLVANMDTGEQRTICRLSRNVFKWFDTEEVDSPYVNLRRYRIKGKSEGKSTIPSKDCSILHLLK